MNKKQRCSSSSSTTEEEEEEEEATEMESIIVWQTPANPPMRNDYIFRNGRRHVRPYYFEFISHAKNRWEGKNLVKLFAEEFKGRPYEYYVNAVKYGRIQVDGKNVPISHVIRPSQKITHFLHRHEPPVMECDIQILHKEHDFITVYKPASVPVHPCGQYRKNTVVGILEAEHGLAPLFPVHRLDRLVSGLLIIARTAAKADLFSQQIVAGMVHKRYVAKVIGVFPEEEQVVNANVYYDHKEGRSTTEVGQVGESFNSTQSKVKSACTKFKRITTDGTHSIVLCEPITGRSHQIRVHLQYLGHPIANDVLYLSDTVCHRSTQGSFADVKSVMSPTSDIPLENNTEDVEDNVEEDFSIDPMCTNCPDLIPKGYGAQEEGLWLHCAKYSGPDWTYECPYPDWAVLEQ